MNIEEIINEDVNEVNTEKIELPQSVQTLENENENTSEDGTQTDEDGTQTQRLSLEQLSGLIIGAFDVVNKFAFKKIEPRFDASLTADEIKVIDEPLKIVLKSYDIAVTPPIALLVAVVGVEVGKFMQLKMFQATLAMQETQEYEETERREPENN